MIDKYSHIVKIVLTRIENLTFRRVNVIYFTDGIPVYGIIYFLI
jgi:hypothetical protein